MISDPRRLEYREALAAVSGGLRAPAGAGERYRRSLHPYAESHAEEIDALLVAGRTHPDMRVFTMEALLREGIPLGILAFGFKATAEELDRVTAAPPVEPEPIDEVERLKQMPYRTYLKTPHWQNVREKALQQAENRCGLCNSPDALEVHHRTYARRGEERPADVFVLCADCHSRHHGTTRAA